MNRYRCNTLNKKILSRIKKRKIFERCYDGSVTFVISNGRYPGDLWVGLRLPWLPDASVWSGGGSLSSGCVMSRSSVFGMSMSAVRCPTSVPCPAVTAGAAWRGAAASRPYPATSQPPVTSHSALPYVTQGVTSPHTGRHDMLR